MTKGKFSVIRAKFNGYCDTCKFSIFKNEKIRYNGLAHHLDCTKALQDNAPRRLNPLYVQIYGEVNRKSMKKLLRMKDHVEAARRAEDDASAV